MSTTVYRAGGSVPVLLSPLRVLGTVVVPVVVVVVEDMDSGDSGVVVFGVVCMLSLVRTSPT